jgi:hypothetical protein
MRSENFEHADTSKHNPFEPVLLAGPYMCGIRSNAANSRHCSSRRSSEVERRYKLRNRSALLSWLRPEQRVVHGR